MSATARVRDDAAPHADAGAVGRAAPAPRPFILQGSRGGLCAVYFAPHDGTSPRGDVLVVPPFAEEMNRCRAMVSLQARAWAELGVGTLVLDPYGTGDSAGEFVEATWDQWRDDLRRGIAWLEGQANGCRALLALRLGAAMAGELARGCASVRNLLLWQPVLSGKTFYTQFLRIRIAAEMNLPDRVKTTQELRQLSAAGQAVEVSGYEVGAELATALDAVVFDTADWPARVQVDWFEVHAASDPALAPISLKAIESLQAAGAAVHAQAVAGPAFWQVHERELAPHLIEAMARRVGAWRADAAVRSSVPRPEAANPAQRDVPLVLRCGDDHLAAYMHQGEPGAERGVVIVVAGGPQYRAGAHRQFVATARKLAAQGLPVLRFDLRGMGDSSGSYLGFEHAAPDIRAAIDGLQAREPQLREVVLLGECESASGILFYAWQDPRVAGAVLINPWVRTEEGQAQVILKDYYLDRIRSREFWGKVRSGDFSLIGSLKSMIGVIRAYFRGRQMFARSSIGQNDDLAGLPLPAKTATGLSRFKGPVLLLMSGHDYIAREFDEVTAASKAWEGLLDDPRVVRVDVAGADHTFSRKVWKGSASDAIVRWVRSW